MKNHRSPSPSPAAAHLVPPALIPFMAVYRVFFTAPVWDHVLVLVQAHGERRLAGDGAWVNCWVRALPPCVEPSTLVEPRCGAKAAGHDHRGILAQWAGRDRDG